MKFLNVAMLQSLKDYCYHLYTVCCPEVKINLQRYVIQMLEDVLAALHVAPNCTEISS